MPLSFSSTSPPTPMDLMMQASSSLPHSMGHAMMCFSFNSTLDSGVSARRRAPCGEVRMAAASRISASASRQASRAVFDGERRRPPGLAVLHVLKNAAAAAAPPPPSAGMLVTRCSPPPGVLPTRGVGTTSGWRFVVWTDFSSPSAPAAGRRGCGVGMTPPRETGALSATTITSWVSPRSRHRTLLSGVASFSASFSAFEPGVVNFWNRSCNMPGPSAGSGLAGSGARVDSSSSPFSNLMSARPARREAAAPAPRCHVEALREEFSTTLVLSALAFRRASRSSLSSSAE
mmetsp:Transcript_68947/g.202388  ORF Transcript_68947/g.202388 Transcript_68947/m.202388 type:complete len:289 (+) Transcript_68947:1202-2068(+)